MEGRSKFDSHAPPGHEDVLIMGEMETRYLGTALALGMEIEGKKQLKRGKRIKIDPLSPDQT